MWRQGCRAVVWVIFMFLAITPVGPGADSLFKANVTVDVAESVISVELTAQS